LRARAVREQHIYTFRARERARQQTNHILTRV
jgi:hypothetical protein